MTINLTIPLHNEETILAENVRTICHYLAKETRNENIVETNGRSSLQWQIILADNGSTDKTKEIARKIVGAYCNTPLQQIKYLFIPRKGKGRAIREGWQKFPADYYIFMDADLSTDLEALPRMIAELENGADIVIGSRYLPESKTTRSASRKFVSLIYRWLARRWLGLPFSDLPCGFKGVNQKIVRELLPRIKNNEWFFDTELLYRAYQGGYKIKEMPVQWTETEHRGRKSRVGLFKVSWGYVKELMRIKFVKN